MDKDTIVSQATPYGYSSVAVIRISGTRAFSVANKISKNKKTFTHHMVALLPLFDSENQQVDRGVFLFFKGPKSYTGEDVVEISCHGNPVICAEIIRAIIKKGCRLAHPGEYTKRAFLNKKINLSQAESIGLLISSRSKEAIRANLKNIEPTTTKKIIKIKDRLLFCASKLEFELDITEEEHPSSENLSYIVKTLKNNIIACRKTIGSYNIGTAYNTGFRVAVVGEPNAGKSTLVNAITQTNNSIVSKTPGTTRDAITTSVVMFGCPLIFVDTAGLRDTKNKIEKEGVRRTKAEIDSADLVLSVFSPETEPVDFIKYKKQLTVYNKVDLQKETNIKFDCSVSSLYGRGIKSLIKKIEKRLIKKPNTDIVINTERQRSSLLGCLSFMESALDLIKRKPPTLEIAALETRCAIDKLEVFLGETTTDDILNKVFSDFCVGK